MSSDPRRIAIFRIGHIGDTIVALPALWTVRKRFPDAKIVYLTKEDQVGKLVQGSEVLRPGTVYDEMLAFRLGSDGMSKWEIVKTLVNLRRQRLDMLVYIPAYRSPWQVVRDKKFFGLAGIKRIVGMQGQQEVDYYPKGRPLPTIPHESNFLLSILARDGVSVPDDPRTMMHMALSAEEREFARSWIASQGFDPTRPTIGIGPGSKMPAKLWSLERFVQVTRTLDREYSPNLLVFGSSAESDVCQAVCDAASCGVNTAGRLTVRQSAAVFEHCRLYIGNDTGTMHIAASAGVPCVAIFSARDWPGRWYPNGDGHIVHRLTAPCEGCMLDACDRSNLCLDLIGAERVLTSIRNQLGRGSLVREAPAR